MPINHITNASNRTWVSCHHFCKKPQKCRHLTQAVVAGVRANMNIDNLTNLELEKFELFKPASCGQIRLIETSFPNIYVNEYIEIIRKSNGIGEIYSNEGERFVHNTIICSAEDAIDYSKEEFSNKCLVVGWPGTDGIKFVVNSNLPSIFAYYPIDDEFVKIADNISDLLGKWGSNEIQL